MKLYFTHYDQENQGYWIEFEPLIAPVQVMAWVDANCATRAKRYEYGKGRGQDRVTYYTQLMSSRRVGFYLASEQDVINFVLVWNHLNPTVKYCNWNSRDFVVFEP